MTSREEEQALKELIEEKLAQKEEEKERQKAACRDRIYWRQQKELENKFSCSFCGESEENVKRLVAGPTRTGKNSDAVAICDACILLAYSIVEEEIGKGKLGKV